MDQSAGSSSHHGDSTTSSSGRDGKRPSYLADDSPAAYGVAVAPQRDETLYEAMVRYHQDDEDDNSFDLLTPKVMPPAARLKRDEDYYEEDNDDDRKPAPAAANLKKPPPAPVATMAQLKQAPVVDRTDRSPDQQQADATNFMEKGNSSFYRVAMEEAMRGDNMPLPSSEPLVRRPGAVQVAEPVVKPDSAIYRQHYPEAAGRGGYRSVPAASQNQNSKQALPKPMGVYETRNALAVLKEERRKNKTELTNSQVAYAGEKSRPTPKYPSPANIGTSEEEMDGDLLLALELSKQEAQAAASQRGKQTHGSNYEPPKQQVTPHTRPSQPSPPPPLDAASSSSLNDLMLALRLSEEESRNAGNRNPRHENLRSSFQSINFDDLLVYEMQQQGEKSGMLRPDERATDFVAAGISTDRSSRPEEQWRILEKIREEQEQKELDMALRASAEAANLKGGNSGDFFVQQQHEMAKWSAGGSQYPPPPDFGRGISSRSVSSQESMERRRELVQRGTVETQRAIHSGNAHIVTCNGCKGRLQAPVSYSLVFCPKCHTISPT